MVKKILIILSFMAAAVGAVREPPLQGLPLSPDTAFAANQEDGQPCPPECVTDSMEIVTWYPSPYNEYEELRLYPISDSNSACGNDTRGLMYYDNDEDKVKLCKGPAGLNNWQDLGGGGYWDVSPSNSNDIYYTPSGNVGIGTDTPQAKLHIKDTDSSEPINVSTTFNYTGGQQIYTVPLGVTSITIEALGAQGNGIAQTVGGLGGKAIATVTVIPGEIIYIYVGGRSGYNGGGVGGQAGGSGGDASDVRRGGTAYSNRIIVAGGGGGGGYWSVGDEGGVGGGTSGANGGGGSAGGGGGTQVAGGAGGADGGAGPFGNAAHGNGGSGGIGIGGGGGYASGGGGGGYFGGGGGGGSSVGVGGGGGGGSSYVTGANTSTQPGVNYGNGKVIIFVTQKMTLYVQGDMGVTGSKNFIIPHPTKPGMKLVHSSLEGPEVGVYYRGQARLDNGQTVITLPDYFEALTRIEDRTVQLTAKGEPPFLLSYASIQEGKFTVYGTNPNGEFSWEVKAVRKDIPPLVVEKE